MILLLRMITTMWGLAIEGWVLTTASLGIVAQVCWIISLLVGNSIAPVLLIFKTSAATGMVALVVMFSMWRIILRLGGAWIILKKIGGLGAAHLGQLAPVNLDRSHRQYEQDGGKGRSKPYSLDDVKGAPVALAHTHCSPVDVAVVF